MAALPNANDIATGQFVMLVLVAGFLVYAVIAMCVFAVKAAWRALTAGVRSRRM